MLSWVNPRAPRVEQSFRVLLNAAAWRRARPGVLRIDIVVQTVLGVSAVVLVVAVIGACGSGGNAAVQSSSLARRLAFKWSLHFH